MPEYYPLPSAALPFPEISPIIVSIGPIAVHWYGVGYVVGILFAWWYAKRLIADRLLWPDRKPPMAESDLDDFLVWAAVGVVVGGRLGYVLFYDFPRYISRPLDALAVWEGGMSFHGGMLGTILAMVLFARSRNIPVWSMLDTVSTGVPVGLGLVRLANFINSELWGRTTDMPWAFVFPNGGPEPRHPSQLYEALLEGLVLFLVLRLATHYGKKLKSPGFVGGTFVAGYGLSRVIVEFFREPDAHIGYLAGDWLTMGIILSLPMILAGGWAMITARQITESTGSRS